MAEITPITHTPSESTASPDLLSRLHALETKVQTLETQKPSPINKLTALLSMIAVVFALPTGARQAKNALVKTPDTEITQPADLLVRFDPKSEKLSFKVKMQASNSGNEEDKIGLDAATFATLATQSSLTASMKRLADPNGSWDSIAINPAESSKLFIAEAGFSGAKASNYLVPGPKCLQLSLSSKKKPLSTRLCFSLGAPELAVVIHNPDGLQLPLSKCENEK